MNEKAELTDNVEGDEVAHFGLCADLALVLTGVTGLHVLDLKRPSVGGLDEERLEPIVGDERVAVHGEDVGVPTANPRHGLVAQLFYLAWQVCMGS